MDSPPVLSPAHPEPGEDWSADDPALLEHVRARLPPAAWADAERRLAALGRVAPADVDPLARLADKKRPVLTADGDVAYDDAYRDLARLAREHRVFTLPWEGGSRVLGFALGYLYGQAECGYFCPACMTDGAAFVLAKHAPPDLQARFVPRLVQPGAEGAFEGAMFLTEKAGGSDVGATRTRATPAADGTWRLTGDKWFCSNVTADVVLTLARMPDGATGTSGLGLFLLPRRLPDGTLNPGVTIVKLKDKLGVTSMATGEVTLDGAFAWLLAGERQGFRAMLDMVNLSRLYNAVGSVAIARRCVREGVRNGRVRHAFGKRLLDHPLYARAVLDLAVETEGALAFTLDASAKFDRAAAGDADADRALRALTPLAKAATAKLAVRAASEACEFLGGNGYIEDFVTPRLLRDAQVLPIWEGTTNVQALDLLRVESHGKALTAVVEEAAARLAAARSKLPTGLAEAIERGLVRARESVAALAEPSALRVLGVVYHAFAGVLLAEAAARSGGRAVPVAELYVARHVHPRGDAGERALEAGLARAGEVLGA